MRSLSDRPSVRRLQAQRASRRRRAARNWQARDELHNALRRIRRRERRPRSHVPVDTTAPTGNPSVGAHRKTATNASLAASCTATSDGHTSASAERTSHAPQGGANVRVHEEAQRLKHIRGARERQRASRARIELERDRYEEHATARREAVARRARECASGQAEKVISRSGLISATSRVVQHDRAESNK